MDSKNSNQNEKGTNKFSDFTGKVKSQWNGLSKTKKIITGVAGLAIVGVAGVAVYQAMTGTTVTSAVTGSPLKITVNSADVIVPEDAEKGSTYVAYNITFENKRRYITGVGNGRLDAVSNALRDNTTLTFDILDYKEHSLGKGSTSKAVSYVKIIDCRHKIQWGVGVHEDIIMSSVKALFAAINRAVKQRMEEENKEK